MANKNLSAEKKLEILAKETAANDKKYEKMSKIISKNFISAHNMMHAKMDTFCIIYQKSEFVDNIYFFKFLKFPKVKEFYDFSIDCLCKHIAKDLKSLGIARPIVTYKDSIDSCSGNECYRIYCKF